MPLASNLLNVPEQITAVLLCLSFPGISGAQAPGSHSRAVPQWKVCLWKGCEWVPGSWLTPRVGQPAQDAAAGHRVSLRLGRVDLKLRRSSRSLPNQDSGRGGGSGPRMEGAVRSPAADPPMGYGSSSPVDPRAESLGWASPFPSCFWRSGGVGSTPQGCGWAQSPTEKR